MRNFEWKFLIVVVYVGDIIFVGSYDDDVKAFKKQIGKEFETSYLDYCYIILAYN